jgi:hypothetical protein
MVIVAQVLPTSFVYKLCVENVHFVVACADPSGKQWLGTMHLPQKLYVFHHISSFSIRLDYNICIANNLYESVMYDYFLIKTTDYAQQIFTLVKQPFINIKCIFSIDLMM